MDTQTRKAVVELAEKAAVVFAEEFPGEVIGSSDWDSAAWEIDGREYVDVEGAWDLYRETLRGAVAKAAKASARTYLLVDSDTTEVLAEEVLREGAIGMCIDALLIRESLDAGAEGHVYAELAKNGRWTYLAPQHVADAHREHGDEAGKYVRRVYVEVLS